ncbi:MAG: hypothetical protein GWN99_11325 [Gemmatimonadetes bacterium]|uniref:AMP-activated protein kinase glycogen-binding domain-containing protein n=1 Tax=Candidatus Kutchimonas denitrificans TaxID=3056748 RepID=A0AAE4Z668_9BACT|nr:hypothetical protein [Gemmatimonadota bacterium]NIR74074.1 hypothetical protein [Candidatus Kutchimonas denitrificans]NIS01636.1 hypothetical protein [Gemmatimonadota bacterium]NIT67374.1 hypothetical protein [Gemmatimonadota bacterium]NIU52737.1 hypothetical protein [Gemmatimonadota bacterium]
MSDPDRTIDRVVSELRRPVPVDSEAKARVIEEVRRTRRWGPLAWLPRLMSTGQGWRQRGATLAALGVAALLLALALVALWPSPGGSTRSQAVQFVYIGGEASQVHLVGDFNDWDRSATPLQRSATGEVWSVTVSLEPGPYRYAFIVDEDRWVADEAAPRAPADDFGAPNSVIIVEGPST